jgi:trimethylamine--corrinoid protein Co-methyltransferase
MRVGGGPGVSPGVVGLTDRRLSLNVLDEAAIKRIHETTLQVLEEVGVRFPSPKALDLFEANGARVDRASGIVKIRGKVLAEALSTAPPAWTLAALKPDLDLPLDGRSTWLGTDGCGVEIIDAVTGERRRSTLQDVADVARVADALEGIGFHWTALSAQDCPADTRSLHEMLAIWNVSRKHLQTETIVNEREARAAVEMAAALAGGRDALRKRPILSLTQCTISPLAHDRGSIEAGLVAAAAGLPIGYMTMASCASTGPATVAGSLVVGNAEVLSALALMQMAAPGCPVYYAAAQTSMDLRTGAYTGGGPEDHLFAAATSVLADFYEVPLSMGAFATGAKEPDWQCALDNALAAFAASVNGADMLLGAGLLHGSRILAYEMLVMDAEIWSLVRHFCRGIQVDDTTLALDAIREVGPGGNFLAHRHTKTHMRDLWLPQILDRRPFSTWDREKDGARQWALDRARAILRDHRPEPLPEPLQRELKRIIDKSGASRAA